MSVYVLVLMLTVGNVSNMPVYIGVFSLEALCNQTKDRLIKEKPDRKLLCLPDVIMQQAN